MSVYLGHRMSLKKKRANISLPSYVMDYIEGLMSEMGSNKSDIIEALIFYGSQNEDDFKSQYGEAEDIDEEEEEEEED